MLLLWKILLNNFEVKFDYLYVACIFSQWGKNINDQEKEYYEKFVTRLANLSYENIQNLSKYSRNSKLNNLNLKNLVAEVKFIYNIFNENWRKNFYTLI